MCLRVYGYEFTIISEKPTAPIFRVDNWGLRFFQNFGILRQHFTSHMTVIFRQHWPKETRNAKERGQWSFTFRSRTLTFLMRPANSGYVHCWLRPRKGSIQACRIVTQCGSSFHACWSATQLQFSPYSNTRANPYAGCAPIPSCKDLFVCIFHMKCSILLGYVINLKKCLSLCSGSLDLQTVGWVCIIELNLKLLKVMSLDSVIQYYAMQVCEKDCCNFQLSNNSRRFNFPSFLCLIYSVVTVLHSVHRVLVGWVVQSAWRLATGWTVQGSNPGEGEIFRTCPDRPLGPPSLLYNGYLVFPGG